MPNYSTEVIVKLSLDDLIKINEALAAHASIGDFKSKMDKRKKFHSKMRERFNLTIASSIKENKIFLEETGKFLEG